MVSAPGPPIGIEREQQQRKTFDISNFDINAVLRGAQLTLVGGEKRHSFPGPRVELTSLQPTELCRTRTCSRQNTTSRLSLLCWLA